jgi:hypothetical protein
MKKTKKKTKKQKTINDPLQWAITRTFYYIKLNKSKK